MRPQICVSIPVRNIPQAGKQALEVSRQGADYIEYRVDYLKNLTDLDSLVKMVRTPTIFTLRSQDEGGLSTREDQQTYPILQSAANVGFTYIDIEATTPDLKKKVQSLKEQNVQVIISKHFLQGTPSISHLQKTLENEINAQADICKIVTTANSYQDNLTVLNFLAQKRTDKKVVCFAMGPLGKFSRIVAPYMGSYFTFASFHNDLSAAPGQITFKNLINIYQVISNDHEHR